MKFFKYFTLTLLVSTVGSYASEQNIYINQEMHLLSIMQDCLALDTILTRQILDANGYFVTKPIHDQDAEDNKTKLEELKQKLPDFAQSQDLQPTPISTMSIQKALPANNLQRLQSQQIENKALFEHALQNYINRFGRILEVPGSIYGSNYKIVSCNDENSVITPELYDQLISILSQAASHFEKNSLAYASNKMGVSALSDNMSIELELDDAKIVRFNLIDLLNALQYPKYEAFAQFINNAPVGITGLTTTQIAKGAAIGAATASAAYVAYNKYQGKDALDTENLDKSIAATQKSLVDTQKLISDNFGLKARQTGLEAAEKFLSDHFGQQARQKGFEKLQSFAYPITNMFTTTKVTNPVLTESQEQIPTVKEITPTATEHSMQDASNVPTHTITEQTIQTSDQTLRQTPVEVMNELSSQTKTLLEADLNAPAHEKISTDPLTNNNEAQILDHATSATIAQKNDQVLSIAPAIDKNPKKEQKTFEIKANNTDELSAVKNTEQSPTQEELVSHDQE